MKRDSVKLDATVAGNNKSESKVFEEKNNDEMGETRASFF